MEHAEAPEAIVDASEDQSRAGTRLVESMECEMAQHALQGQLAVVAEAAADIRFHCVDDAVRDDQGLEGVLSYARLVVEVVGWLEGKQALPEQPKGLAVQMEVGVLHKAVRQENVEAIAATQDVWRLISRALLHHQCHFASSNGTSDIGKRLAVQVVHSFLIACEIAAWVM